MGLNQARVVLLFFVAAFFVVAPRVSFADQQIAAVVNEDAISQKDLNDRIRLIMASSGMPNKPELRKKLAPQILNSLIEERLMVQEASRMELGVTADDVARGFETLAQQNNMKADAFKGMMRKGGLSLVTVEDQIKAHLSWGLVVQKKLRPRVTITERDVDDVLERLMKGAGQPEYLLAEIFLPSDNAQVEGKVKQLAASMVTEIRGGRASFFKLAQQFSKSAGSSKGGDLGWVAENQLQQELREGVKGLAIKEVSAPIRTPHGYHILLVREKRQLSGDKLPSRDAVYQMLGQERLDRLQRGYLLDLKASAFIDNRVES